MASTNSSSQFLYYIMEYLLNLLAGIKLSKLPPIIVQMMCTERTTEMI